MTLKTMKRLLIISLFAFIMASCGESYRHPMESELARIDKALESMDKYVELKENRISTIMEPLADESLPLSQQYTIYGRLYEEYAPYQFDQARKMVEKQEQYLMIVIMFIWKIVDMAKFI